MSTDTKDKFFKKVYRNGNVAWSTSTDMKNSISVNKAQVVGKKLISRHRANRFKDVVRKVGEDYGIFENYKPLMTYNDETYSNDIAACKRNLSTKNAGFVEGYKQKDKHFFKDRLKWTRLFEILITIAIVTICVSIVVFQTFQCITKYVYIHLR